MNARSGISSVSVALLVATLSVLIILPQSVRAETLPGGVSDIVRDLGEMRDLSWALLTEARKVYKTNEAALAKLNFRYIEASAVANSLIEQFQLETKARTSMNVKRYKSTLARTREKCQAFTNEWHQLILAAPKSRGTRAGTSEGEGGGDGLTVERSFALATETVGLADSLLGVVSKQKKAFRELDEKQRSDVFSLLEERRWRPLDWGESAEETKASKEGTARGNRGPGQDPKTGDGVGPR